MNAFLTNDVIVCISKFPQTKFYINEKSLEENLVLFINSKYYIINKFVGWKHLFKVFTNKCKIIYALSYALSQLILWNVSSYYYSFGTGSWECALFYFQGFFFVCFKYFISLLNICLTDLFISGRDVLKSAPILGDFCFILCGRKVFKYKN